MSWNAFRKNPVKKLAGFILGATGIKELGKLLNAGAVIALGEEGKYKIRKILTLLAARPVLRKRTIRDKLAALIGADPSVGAEQIKSTSKSFVRKERIHNISVVIERFDKGHGELQKVLKSFLTNPDNELALVDLIPLTAAQKSIGTLEEVKEEIAKATVGASPQERRLRDYRASGGGGSGPCPCRSSWQTTGLPRRANDRMQWWSARQD